MDPTPKRVALASELLARVVLTSKAAAHGSKSHLPNADQPLVRDPSYNSSTSSSTSLSTTPTLFSSSISSVSSGNGDTTDVDVEVGGEILRPGNIHQERLGRDTSTVSGYDQSDESSSAALAIGRPVVGPSLTTDSLSAFGASSSTSSPDLTGELDSAQMSSSDPRVLNTVGRRSPPARPSLHLRLSSTLDAAPSPNTHKQRPNRPVPLNVSITPSYNQKSNAASSKAGTLGLVGLSSATNSKKPSSEDLDHHVEGEENLEDLIRFRSVSGPPDARTPTSPPPGLSFLPVSSATFPRIPRTHSYGRRASLEQGVGFKQPDSSIGFSNLALSPTVASSPTSPPRTRLLKPLDLPPVTPSPECETTFSPLDSYPPTLTSSHKIVSPPLYTLPSPLSTPHAYAHSPQHTHLRTMSSPATFIHVECPTSPFPQSICGLGMATKTALSVETSEPGRRQEEYILELDYGYGGAPHGLGEALGDAIFAGNVGSWEEASAGNDPKAHTDSLNPSLSPHPVVSQSPRPLEPEPTSTMGVPLTRTFSAGGSSQTPLSISASLPSLGTSAIRSLGSRSSIGSLEEIAEDAAGEEDAEQEQQEQEENVVQDDNNDCNAVSPGGGGVRGGGRRVSCGRRVSMIGVLSPIHEVPPSVEADPESHETKDADSSG
ncbi:hypothetical protein DL93DRAFT_2171805 [Clavulina sp. PMI_390]|nr:hypothetical protein DL93DRAFT_2171805 [Clavulina sp. PMI_390]